ncbi:hypothetical protein LSI01_16950 [Furfurilactobacillus siliginis]|uniref:Uncharacterized protein n=1 Tax=Furfurilactobacillus siliginis TaxID=348151 RepID=A0A510VR05_9LACO|nr:hypothetical protein LSI01_16950 [Furfurilactobacillus siliginis]
MLRTDQGHFSELLENDNDRAPLDRYPSESEYKGRVSLVLSWVVPRFF